MATNYNSEILFKQGNQRFTMEMFDEVSRQHFDHNIVQSANSVLTPLAQLSLASVGKSHEEFLKAIGFPNSDATKEAFSEANKRLRSIQGVELRMDNKVYIPTCFQPNEQFADMCKEVFDAQIENIDFQKNEEAANKINTLVGERTNNRIKELIDSSSCNSDTQAILMNTIYFKGAWKRKFTAIDTKDSAFYVSKNLSRKVPYMYQQSSYLHGQSEELGARLVQFSFEGDEIHFLLILPTNRFNLPNLEQKLKKEALLKDAISKMVPEKANFYLPKFTIETTTDLIKVLKGFHIGVTSLFTEGQAGLQNFLKDQNAMHITESKQKAFIEISEEGVEVAVCNVFGTPASPAIPPVKPAVVFNVNHPFDGLFGTPASPAIPPVKPAVIFNVNHPFYFAIRTNDDTELFSGRFIVGINELY